MDTCNKQIKNVDTSSIIYSKKVALPPKGHVPTPEQIALLQGIGVSIAERGGVIRWWGCP